MLRQPATIRLRCAAITRSVADGLSPHFTLDRSKLDVAADLVVSITRERFPDGRIPPHSRWRHFEAGGVDRRAELDALLAGRSPAEQARAHFDLVVPSVLLDAGAGPQWRYREHAATADSLALPVQRRRTDDLIALLDRVGATPLAEAKARAALPPPVDDSAPAPGPGALTRSEGLGVASFRAFVSGVYSASADDPLRSDASTLRLIDTAALRDVFQVSTGNPLVGLEGRAGLLSRLGDALQAEADRNGGEARPGLLFDRLTDGGRRTEITATAMLHEVLRVLAPVWTSGPRVAGVLGGDVWAHRWAGSATADASIDRSTPGWVPFHKLSQWLVYSLIEPLQWAGVQVAGVDALTGLPEYRNGGLLIDAGVIVPRRPPDPQRSFKPADELVVEWRALTVTLLDELAVRVRAQLGVDATQMPMSCLLEGGSWAAGRRLAGELRDGQPPYRIDSDGTVF